MNTASRTFERLVGDKTIPTTLNTKDLQICGDLLSEMNGVAAQVAFVGDLIAQWQYACDMSDATYREWRAKEARVALRADEKMAQWKVDDATEASPKFMEMKELIASLNSDLNWLRAYQSALLVKRDMLKTRVSLELADRSANVGGYGDVMHSHHPTGSMPSQMKGVDSSVNDDDRKANIRSALKDKKRTGE